MAFTLVSNSFKEGETLAMDYILQTAATAILRASRMPAAQRRAFTPRCTH